MSEYKYQMDMQSKLVHAKRVGIEIGEQIGEQRGRLEGRQEIINLLKSGKTLEDLIKGEAN
jgi:predicted transposase YdaD